MERRLQDCRGGQLFVPMLALTTLFDVPWVLLTMPAPELHPIGSVIKITRRCTHYEDRPAAEKEFTEQPRREGPDKEDVQKQPKEEDTDSCRDSHEFPCTGEIFRTFKKEVLT
jgi:hypothetical protein